MSDFPSGMASGERPSLFLWAQLRGRNSQGQFLTGEAEGVLLSGSLSL